MPITAAVYCRISKSDDKYSKVTEQEADCRALADRLGYTVTAVYADDGISATKGKKREGFEDMVLAVARGEFDMVLAKEQSRLERSPMDYQRVLLASTTTGTQWHTVAEGAIDPADDDDEFMSMIRSSMNKKESRNIARRVTSRNARTIAEGRPIVTKRPFGWEKDGLTIREEEAEAVRWAADALIGGKSLHYIAKHLNETGPTPVVPQKEILAAESEGRVPVAKRWTATAIPQLLSRSRNVGRIVHRGAVVADEGIPAILDAEVYDLVMSILRDPKRSVTRSRELKYMLSGVALCGTCGHVMRPTTVNGTPVYRCGSTEPRGAVRHPMIVAHLLDQLATDAVAAHFLTAVGRPDGEVSDAAQIQRALADLRKEKENLADLALTPGFEAVFKKRAAEAHAKEVELQERLGRIARTNAATLLEVESRRALWSSLSGQVSISDAATVHDDIAERFTAMPAEDRRALVRSLLSITVTTGVGAGRVQIEPLDEDEGVDPDEDLESQYVG